MGIDALDLAFRLEKRFGIEISRAEAVAALVDTPGAIHRYLVAKLRGEYRLVPRIDDLFLEVTDRHFNPRPTPTASQAPHR